MGHWETSHVPAKQNTPAWTPDSERRANDCTPAHLTAPPDEHPNQDPKQHPKIRPQTASQNIVAPAPAPQTACPLAPCRQSRKDTSGRHRKTPHASPATQNHPHPNSTPKRHPQTTRPSISQLCTRTITSTSPYRQCCKSAPALNPAHPKTAPTPAPKRHALAPCRQSK